MSSPLPVPTARPPHSLRTLRHRDFRLFAFGGVVSNLGTWAQYVGIGWAAKTFTDSEFALGLAFAAQFIPSLLLSPVAGVVADRFDRRMLVILGNLFMVAPPALIGLLVQRGEADITNLVLIVFVGGIGQAFTLPATTALIPSLVPTEEIQPAIALNSGLVNATRVVGPALGAAAIEAWGIAGGFYVNSLSFLAVVLSLLVVRARPGRPSLAGEPFFDRLSAGFRYARLNPTVGWLLLLIGVATFFAMHAPLMPVFAKDVLGGDVSTYGWLSAAPGVGAVVGLLFAGEIRSDRRRRFVLVASVVSVGAALALVSVSRAVPLSVAALAGFGLGYFLLLTIGTTMLMEASVDEYRGRVMGLLGTASIGMVPINSLLAGLIASLLGAPLTVGVCGGAVLGFATWFVVTGRTGLIHSSVAPIEPEARTA